ncbi:HAMP domain-containing protein, partial [Clostridium saudiense]|nr:HAMP domain-containing protein [Clostridium saudiense]
MFFKALNTTLIIVSILAIILSIIIGIILSSNISKPILDMASSTKEISKGNYNKKLKCDNNIKELNEMICSINELSNSLQKDEEMRKMLTRDISHELRTPLTTIGLQIESLIDKVWEPTEERLISIQSEILRLTRLVKSLEELSHYDSESLILEKEEVDIQELIKSLVINFEKQALDKNIQITTTLKSIVAN